MNSNNQTLLNQEQVQKLFDYKDGKLYWKTKIAKCIKIGGEAGFMQGNGYRGVVINRKIYPLHRIIFLYAHGYLPQVVDHVDGDLANNSIENLRAATVSENGFNSKLNRKNTSGVKNVTWNSAAKQWTVLIQKQGTAHYFGRYKTLAEAQTVALQARKQLHGSFARND